MGIPADYNLSFNNGKLSVGSQELLDALNGPKGDEVLGALKANEVARIKVDDWLPDKQQLDPRMIEVKVRTIKMWDQIRSARQG